MAMTLGGVLSEGAARDGYVLGVDLGTTFTAAATWRDGHSEVVALGDKSVVIPSVVLLRDNGVLLTGAAAERRGMIEPLRLAREFKRRFGDRTPLLLAGTPLLPEELTAALLRAVVDLVTTREGGSPDRICLTYPANWGAFKQDVLRSATRQSGIEVPVSMITEPAAAAAAYAAEQRVAPGSVVAVYDLGGGTFDATVLRKGHDGFELLGVPEGIEQLGGIDLDAAVFDHVTAVLGARWTELDEDDAATIAAVARLRAECVDAKEMLSSDTDVSIPVLLPGFGIEVRLTRAELEEMARPMLRSTVDVLRRTLASAQVEPAELDSVLLVGGASRMPLVAQMVGAELGRPVAVDAHPKHAVALGAARFAGRSDVSSASGTVLPGEPGGTVLPGEPGGTVLPGEPGGTVLPGEPGGTVLPGEPESVAAVSASPPPGPAAPRPVARSRRRGVAAAAAGLLVVLVAVALAGWWSGVRNSRSAGASAADLGPTQQELRALVDQGVAVAGRDLRGNWVPQISAEPGAVDDSVVLAEHRRLVGQVPGAVLIRSRDYPQVFESGAAEYVTLADAAFGTADEVFVWCGSRPVDCVARRLVDTGTPADNTDYPIRPVATGHGSTGAVVTDSGARVTTAEPVPSSPPAESPAAREARPPAGGSGSGAGDGPPATASPDEGAGGSVPSEPSTPSSDTSAFPQPPSDGSTTTQPEPAPVQSATVVPAVVDEPTEAIRPVEPLLPTAGVARPLPAGADLAAPTKDHSDPDDPSSGAAVP
ncbi:Hsp70 family protein [Skermania piniformis]|uniref:Hsp70 family protein n=2 Tax=Skermania pinensis TaxID=39122 RepID=A0ABX8S8F8_9ACTN|nr:Hsp70 family protein [Skermania piniformis]